MGQQLTREQLEFARSIGATHYYGGKYYRSGSHYCAAVYCNDKWCDCVSTTDLSGSHSTAWDSEKIDFSPLEYTPKVGEECEARSKLNSGSWVKITPDYVGSDTVVFTTENGKDTALYRSLSDFRPLPDPIHQRRNELLEAWKRQSLENAHDTEASVLTVGEMIDFIVELEDE